MTPSTRLWALDANRDPPVYARHMVGSELYMHRYWDKFDADGQVCIGLTFTSSLGIQDLKDRARRALDKLRFVCPIIACTVEDVIFFPQWVYTPSADREAWLDLAFVVQERGASLNVTEFIRSMNSVRLPYKDGRGTTAFLRTYLLTTSEEAGKDSKEYGLYFHGPHAIIDAGPAFHALNLMCEWISGGGMDVIIDPLEEWKNLPVDPVVATGGPCPEWETRRSELSRVFEGKSAHTTLCHTLAPPTRPLKLSDPPIVHAKTLSESESAAITATTKKLGVTITSLFHAAFSLAQFKMNPPSTTDVNFSSEATVVALERFFKPPVNPRTHFISSFTLLPLRFSMAGPLAEHGERAKLFATAKKVQEQFDTHLANPCLPQMLAMKAGVPTFSVKPKEQAVSETTPDAPLTLPWTCAFNNLGVIERWLKTHHGALDVVRVDVGNRLRNYLTMHMWMLHSKLYFQVQGATAWGEECIKTMLEETIRIGSLVLDSASGS